MTDIWTIGSLLAWTRQYFDGKGVENSRLDAEVLLSYVLERDRLYLYTHYDEPLQPDELGRFRAAVKKRAQRLPVAYITGRKPFMGLDFCVSPAVLVPRPDTEVLVETVLEELAARENPRILDIGTGSGAIVISLLVKIPAASGVGVDIAPEALAVAAGNADRLGTAGRLTLLAGDLFAPVSGLFDAIVSNPPYIPDGDIAGLAPEVRCEPHGALAGGADGLTYYRRLLADAGRFLSPGGFIAFELGMGQARPVAALAKANGFRVVRVCRDYGGIDRVMILHNEQNREAQ